MSASGVSIAPFEDPVADVQVLGRSLGEVLEEELDRAGLTVVEEPPADEPYLAISARTWVTAPLLRAFLDCAEAPARLRVDNVLWLETTAALYRKERTAQRGG